MYLNILQWLITSLWKLIFEYYCIIKDFKRLKHSTIVFETAIVALRHPLNLPLPLAAPTNTTRHKHALSRVLNTVFTLATGNLHLIALIRLHTQRV